MKIEIDINEKDIASLKKAVSTLFGCWRGPYESNVEFSEDLKRVDDIYHRIKKEVEDGESRVLGIRG